MKHTVDIITMGCSKNLVDSQVLIGRFRQAGFDFYHNPDMLHGDIAVVNTCGFIGDAKAESVQQICDLVELKNNGMLREIIVMGCLSQRYREELTAEIPEIDRMYGKFDWTTMVEDILADDAIADDCSTDSEKRDCSETEVINSTTVETPYHPSAHYAYIKISEGCNRRCAYCAIPLITGPHRSRSIEDICNEVRRLVADGVHEFQLIAQELTFYGIDLYHEQRIAELVERIADIPGVEWIRLHYAYPAQFPLDLLRVMRERPNVCKYLDIALQHISDNMLTRMQRHITKQETLNLIETIRAEVPGICLRTTLMVGFPGETEEDFEELLEFTRTVRFDRMGAFTYSEEEDTYAALHYTNDISEDMKRDRLDRLMAVQQTISADLLNRMVGSTVRVIIDRREGEWYVSRTQYDSPDVDCEVLLKADDNESLEIGSFYNVCITRTEEFDLYATLTD